MLLERLHQRRLVEPRRRLREVLRSDQAEQLQLLALDHLRERGHFLLRLVGPLLIHAEEPVERDPPTVRPQRVAVGADVEAGVLELGRSHLRRERALPDERVQAQLVLVEEAPHPVRGAREVRRADRLVRFLCALAPRLEVPRLLECILRAELARDHVLRLLQRAFGHVQRVGPHVGDEADRRIRTERDAFIELLREHHRPLHRVAELPRSVLLQRRGRVGAAGAPRRLALLEARDLVHRVGERRAVLLGVGRVRDRELVSLLLNDLRLERLAGVVREERVDRPVLLGCELLDLPLAVDDEPERDRLDPARGEAVADLLPEQRGHRVADEPIDDATGLLGVDEVLVDLTRAAERLGDRLGGDLVEGDPAQLRGGHVHDLGHVPRDRFALAVEVARQPDPVGELGLLLQEPGMLLGVGRDDVLGGERLGIDAELRLRQIPDVAERGLDRVARTEHPTERPGLRRAFDHDEVAAL